MPAKTKSQQKEDVENVQGRDLFMTPNYATELIVPFLFGHKPPQEITVWECAAGQLKMSKVLESYGFNVISTDLSCENSFNFLVDRPDFDFDCILTNTPFSLKRKFYDKCVEYEKPFGLLLPADYSGWIIEAVKNGAEKVIPTRRIDYITPNILQRIHEGQIWETYLAPEFEEEYKNLNKFKKELPETFEEALRTNIGFHNYSSIYKTPNWLLRKYSSSDFHSMWLTKGFGLGKSETFVELTNSMKDNI